MMYLFKTGESMKKLFLILICLVFFSKGALMAEASIKDNNSNMIIRISEIEVYPEFLNEYLKYAKEIAEKSIEKEKGVVSIYPMALIEDNNQIRILEIYKDKESYEKHIESEHFQKYKKGTINMVKSLKLVDTYQLSPKNFNEIFKRN